MEFDKDQSRSSIISRQLEDTRILDFPLGFFFDPTDEELINHYLKKKLNNEPIPLDIYSVNLYMDDPQELTGHYPMLGKNEWYFFTSRDRKYPKGNRPNRAAGNGYWKATTADKPIYDNINVCIGFMKTLVFNQGNSPKGTKTNWIMHEYVVADQPSRPPDITSASQDMLLDNFVLCRIYKRSHGDSKDDEHAAVSISCQTEEQQTAENEILATHKRAKYGHQEHNIIPGECNLFLVLPAQQNEPNLPRQQQNLPSPPGFDQEQNNSGNIESQLGSLIGLISDDMIDIGPPLSIYDYDLGDNNLPWDLPSLLDNIDHLQEPFSCNLFPEDVN